MNDGDYVYTGTQAAPNAEKNIVCQKKRKAEKKKGKKKKKEEEENTGYLKTACMQIPLPRSLIRFPRLSSIQTPNLH